MNADTIPMTADAVDEAAIVLAAGELADADDFEQLDDDQLGGGD